MQHVDICDEASVSHPCPDDPSRHSGHGPSTLTSARSIRTETAAAVIHRITSASACNTLTSAMKHPCCIRCLVTYRVTRPASIRLTSAIERPYRNRASMIYRITSARMQHVDIHDRAFVLHPLPRDSSRHSARSRYVDICDEAFVPEPRLDDLSHHSRPLQHVDIRDRAFVLKRAQHGFAIVRKQWISLLHFQPFSTRFHSPMHTKICRSDELRMHKCESHARACGCNNER
jgi:hypothetical protein